MRFRATVATVLLTAISSPVRARQEPKTEITRIDDVTPKPPILSRRDGEITCAHE